MAAPAAAASTASIAGFGQPGVRGRLQTLVVSDVSRVGDTIPPPSDEPNNIVIDSEAFPGLRVRDLASPISAGLGCVQRTANEVFCQNFTVGGNIGSSSIRTDADSYQVFTGGGSDRINVRAPLPLVGGVVEAGPGDDFIDLGTRGFGYSPADPQTLSRDVPRMDSISGGPGTDTVSYSSRAAVAGTPADPLYEGANEGVTINAASLAQFDDGERGSEDRIGADVESVVGTMFHDVLLAPNKSVPVRLDGFSGSDVLAGTALDDTLIGREQAAIALLQPAPRAFPDQLLCGLGIDTAIMDLMDTQVGCENRSIAAIDEGGILAIPSERVRVRGGAAAVRLFCPSSSKTRCDGRLTLRRGARLLGRARYRLGIGAGATVRVHVGRARGKVTATAVESDSRHRPKTTVAAVTLR